VTNASPTASAQDATALFAANFRNVHFEDLPDEVVRITKDQVLDFFAVALGGVDEAGVREMRDLVLEWGGAPQSRILVSGERVPAPNAAQVNATMAHSLDFDDVHEDAIMHPGVVTIPTALAMSEYVGGASSRGAGRLSGPVSGREFITAVAVGTDFICRLGLATRPGESIHQYGWHLTTLFGYLTAAGLAARLLGMNEAGITNAIGIGYHQSSGNGQCVKDGALTKRMGPGMAVRGGIASAMMAERGITGARNCLEGAAGMYHVYHGHSYSREKLIGELGRRFESVNVSIKPYPCCRGVHPSIDAALSLVAAHDIRPENVKSIVIYCGEATYGLLGSPLEVKARPRNFVDAQFSLAWGVATAIARRRAVVDDFTPEAIVSPDILAVSAKIDVRNDPALDRGDQGMEPARVEITMNDGAVYAEQVDFPTGTPARPLSFADVERKFDGCLAHAGQPIPAASARALVDAIARLDEVEDVTALLDLAT
jgi:2-methylcitrate dehydratase PrpD